MSLFYIFPVKSLHFIDAQNNSKPHHSKSRHLSDNSNCNFGQLNNVLINVQLYVAEFFTIFYKLPKARLCSWSGCRVPDTSMSDGEMRKAPFERAFARKSGWSGLIMAVVCLARAAPGVVRSYLGYYAGSHQNSAAKRPWARIVLPWVTRWEVLVSYPACLLLLFVKCYFLSSVLSHHTPPFPQTQPQRTVLYPYALCLCFVLMLCAYALCLCFVL